MRKAQEGAGVAVGYRAAGIAAVAMMAGATAADAASYTHSETLYNQDNGNVMATASCTSSFDSLAGPGTLNCTVTNYTSSRLVRIYFAHDVHPGDVNVSIPYEYSWNYTQIDHEPSPCSGACANTGSASRSYSTLSSPNFYDDVRWKLCGDGPGENQMCYNQTGWVEHQPK